jgi:hypothetical protein
VSGFLLGAAAHLGLRVYAEPVVFSPASGMGRKENQGFNAFVPLIDSIISRSSFKMVSGRPRWRKSETSKSER